MSARAAERRFYASIPDALGLIDAVHSGDDHAVRAALTDTDPVAIAVVLAGLVDQDRTVQDLLGWASHAPHVPSLCAPADDHSPAGATSAHGTPGRHTAGCRGAACVEARADYDRTRHARRRQAISA